MQNPTPALLALFLALPAAAGTLAGVTLPDKADVDGKSLVLNGMGLRKKLVIKVYVGGLYLPQKEKSAARRSWARTCRAAWPCTSSTT